MDGLQICMGIFSTKKIRKSSRGPSWPLSTNDFGGSDDFGASSQDRGIFPSLFFGDREAYPGIMAPKNPWFSQYLPVDLETPQPEKNLSASPHWPKNVP